MTPEERLAKDLLDGLAHLKQNQWLQAVDCLERVATDPDLAATEDLADVRARALSLLAQAQLKLDQLAAAEASAGQALQLLKQLGDADGVTEVRALFAQIRDEFANKGRQAQARKEAERLLAEPVEALLSKVLEPLLRADLLVKRANAEFEYGDRQAAAVQAKQALAFAQEAGTVREEVLARMCVARTDPEQAQAMLTAAWQRAERANEFNLVGLVAKAADFSDVTLPTLDGPQMGDS